MANPHNERCREAVVPELADADATLAPTRMHQFGLPTPICVRAGVLQHIAGLL
jgi:hypothetical protein